MSTISYLTWLARKQVNSVNVCVLNTADAFYGYLLSSTTDAVDFIAKQDKQNNCKAVWATVHNIKSGAVLSNNKVAKTAIDAYRYLAIDIDSRVAHSRKVCATDVERAKTLATGDRMAQMLQSYGLPTPLKVMSGNGALFLFPIDLPYTAGNYEMLSSFAAVLARLYDDDDCDIDAPVIKDPSRILGVVGTYNRSKAEVTSEGRQAKMREVIGDYPPNEPMGADDFINAVKRIMADNAVDDSIMGDNEKSDDLMPIQTAPKASQDKTIGWEGVGAADSADKLARCKAYLSKCEDAVSGQGGHDATYRAACECFRFGLSDGDAEKVMRWFNDHKCQPSWTATELSHKLKTAKAEVKDFGCRLNEQEQDKATDYPLTDVGNAEHFAATYGDNLKYVVQWKSWLIWDGRRWAKDKTDRIRRVAMKFVRKDMLDYAKTVKDDDKRAKYLKWTIVSQSNAKIDAILSLASSILACSTEQLDANGNLFNVANGTIELDTLTFRPHNRKDLLTKMSAVKYDPSASAPEWVKFLDRIFQDEQGKPREDVIAYVQRAVGYSMTADVSAEIMLVLYGTGRNGKTTFINAVKLVMGDYALMGLPSLLLKSETHHSANSDDVAELFGCRFVSVSETDDGQRFDENKIKTLVGNGQITAMRKFERPFEFEKTHKIWLDCNHKPKVKGTDNGIWRRLKLVPFLVTIPLEERDEHLGDLLRAEASGILNWALQGLASWLAAGRKLSEPTEVSQASGAYRADSDTFGSFLSECVVNNDAERVPTATAYTAYCRWAEENGMSFKMTRIDFGKKMKEREYGSKVSNGVRYIVGCSLMDETTATADARPF